MGNERRPAVWSDAGTIVKQWLAAELTTALVLVSAHFGA